MKELRPEAIIERKWRWLPITMFDVEIPPGKIKEVYDLYGTGYIYFVTCEVDNPDLQFIWDIRADGIIEIVLSARTLKERGLLNPGDKAIWVSRYDDTAKRYTLMYTPSGFGTPFTGRSRVLFRNPTASPVKVLEFYAWLMVYE